MDSNSWINCPSVFSSSSSSRRCQSRSGGGYEDLEGEDDLKSEFICPFCAEVFDIVGLCCHIDEEHPVEVKNGVINESSSNHSLKMLRLLETGLV
ncbi:hypothetical protein F2Q68_00002694 [Brassica cretica]|uniref:Di19 zinc-binding domain-containing protein n=1 Tax=Brassica cretica TaxID=69181 RepID=A0A8S9JJB6_BRACR|nr:hypothetical protein F2Q68_00002694 [Brassica cretica]